VLNIPRLGIENKLLDFIEDPSRPVDKTTWFDFDRLTFDTGKATLQHSSAEQLQNIAAILKAYPKVKVKVGSYTDNTGDKEANLRLSQDRATNVMRELVRRGVDSSRLEAEGYGEEHPVADNSTPEGRQMNRRISLRVTAK
jgi:OmpA-OmpF porin, OOP family